jgi:23S rRNA (uracil1939-C5)-methyltransferase
MARRARSAGGRHLELTVETLGTQGDGQVRLGDDVVFLPHVLPGERVLARLGTGGAEGLRGEVIELLQGSGERVEPPCPHFGPCGGCTLQHLAPEAYRRWKRGILVEALQRRGFAAAEGLVAPLVALSPGTRRRATLAARRSGNRVALGFHGRGTHRLEDIRSCLILDPRLFAALQPLRTALAAVLPEGKEQSLAMTLTEGGIDLLLSLPAEPDLRGREALAALAGAADLARLSIAVAGGAPQPLLERRPPRLSLGGVSVTLPPGVFLQATPEGEAALVSAVLAAIPTESETVADLFSGVGTFTFPLAQRGHRVHAVEGEAAAVAALEQAARRSGFFERVTVERRDLERRPVLAEELEGGDAALFDPPRAGAKAQSAELAKSDLPLIVAVSCNPATFARDARTLADGGFRLVAATPIDQFPWSAHLELVAAFQR